MIDASPTTHVLDNGTRIISLAVSGHKTAAVVIAWRTGSRAEREEETGYAHLAEHILFPDEPDDLAAFDAMGGQINAWSGQEYTIFYAHVPLMFLYDVLKRLTCRLSEFNKLLSENILERECQAIRNEFFSQGDNTLEFALNRCQGKTQVPEGISQNISPESLNRFISRELHGQSLCVGIAAGNLDQKKILDACAALVDLPSERTEPKHSPPEWRSGLDEHLEGTNPPGILWLMPMEPRSSQYAKAIALGERALCSGFDAPLFRELRDRGWAYGIHTTHEAWTDGGYWALQVVCPSREIPKIRTAVEASVTTAMERLSTKHLNAAWSALNSTAILENDDITNLALKFAVDGLFGSVTKTTEPPRPSVETVRAAIRNSWSCRSCFILGKQSPYSIQNRPQYRPEFENQISQSDVDPIIEL